jgi:preprotein translocase subunit SecB
MSENQINEKKQPEQQFGIQRIYVKDLSFETPNSPAIFTEKWEPALNVDLNTAVTPLSEGIFDIVLTVTVTAKIEEKTAYLAEVQQSGIFNVAGFGDTEMGQMLHSYCPNILFPYAREVLTSLVSRGSFPQLVLSPVNFDAVYAQHLQRQQEQQEQQSAETLTPSAAVH